ncbi:hypothetical protein Tco_1356107, partial [Tanacetum coccineum]
FVSKTQDYQQYRALILDEMINQDIKDSKAYKTYLAFATRKATPKKARKFKKVASLSKKLSPVLEEEPVEKPKLAKKPVDKYTTVPIAGVVIKDTPSEFVPKKKTPAKVVRGKGMDLLSDVALLEAAQLKKTLKKSKLETHKLHASGSSDEVGSQPKVPDEQEDKTTGTDEGTDSGDDERNDDEEYEELYKDVNVRLQATEHEEEGKRDEEMTDAGRDEGTQQTTYEQVKDDEHVILTTVHDTQKTEVALQSSSVSFNFSCQFLNLDNIPPTDTEVIFMMNVKFHHKEPSTQTPFILNIPVTVIPETLTAVGSTIPPTIPPITPLQQQSTPTPTPAPTTATTTTSVPALLDFSSLFGFDQRVFVLEKELLQLKQADYSAQLLETIKSQIPAMVDAQLSRRLKDLFRRLSEILLDKIQKSKSYRGAQEHKDLYDALVKSYKLDKDLFESYGKVYSLKRDREDKDKDEDPLAGSGQWLKKRKMSKDAEPSRGSKSKESKPSSSKGTKS